MSTWKKGELLHGQQFNPTDPAVIPFTQQQMPRADAEALVGTDATEIIPTNEAVSEVKVFDVAGTQALLDAVHISMPVYIPVSSLELPDQLISVTVTVNKNHGDGVSSHPNTQQGFIVSGSGSGSLNPRASASGSAAVLFDIQPVIKQFNRGKMQGTRYFFYMPENPSWADIGTKLSSIISGSPTINALPVFKPVSHVITLKGQSVAVSINADTTVTASDSSSSWSASWDYGSGYNESVELSMKTIVLPPTVHGTITFSSTSDTDTATVSADASTMAITGTSVSVTTIVNIPTPRSKTATATITPTSLAATSPSSVPTSGLYLIDVDIRPYAFDRVVVFAEVVDFSYFA